MAVSGGCFSSDILLCDYFVRGKCENFETSLLWEKRLTANTVGLYMEIILNLPLR